MSFVRALQRKKYRQKYHNFIAEGVKLAREVLQAHTLEVEALFALESWLEAHPGLWQPQAEKTFLVTEAELKKISALSTPQSVLLVLRTPTWQLDARALQTALTLYLDDIRDPGNLGTIWRIADWFGLPQLLCSPECVEPFNPKVIQASMGAFLRVPLVFLPFEELRAAAPELPCAAADPAGENLFHTGWKPPGVLVIGNESRGIRPELMSQIPGRLAIPRGARGGAESLNAAVAAGIFCAFLCTR